ncbi:inositol-pentakisphosphate 2-kinase [Amborella trichopoda]|uniref:inositol-pentakisphosphate 2-kinase n=1 Tax=Amborella trichopoda TaxID=13333 RepID=UPI0005D41AA3|nr:inositol-pentakisphosphate 2-kinase [Amborella trichopoda]XP_020523480.1 inositol-pentakisphosphate 2-kinase [Amborella trichopoda]XP_020523487.1 inositol-pentakisphosphate 2-kinase [Amborella trichopoda]|eukprot:XP_011623523.1 inositol-pentakisphosphate 2-kinase [Amborella trichopoda]
MLPVLQGHDAPDWTYKGEGAANLVLGYRGSSPLFVGKVLRVQKTSKGDAQSKSINDPILSTHDRLLWGDIEELVTATSKEILAHSYVQHVMRPLLASEHVDAGKRVLVSREFLEGVATQTLSQRPAWRVDAAKVDTLSDSALLISDHSLFQHGDIKQAPCIAVEIKPKCGFLPCSRFIGKENFMKNNTTRFKMHQALKVLQGEISNTSKYDPCDLFSGSRGRIRQAIEALFLTPQNNFRIFLNGTLVFGGLGGYFGGSESDAQEALGRLDNALMGLIHAGPGQRINCCHELLAEILFKSGALVRLLEVQKLDKLDIEGVIHAYFNVISQPCRVCKDLGEELSQIYQVLHSLSLKESMDIMKNYLVAATAKDCSLMVCFWPVGVGELETHDRYALLHSTSQKFYYKSSFIDLDMKPLEKMYYYYELDQKIVSYYTSQIVKEACCN